ncbi:MAG: hypothetical protein V8T36_00320, partial [Ruthenibacterium lactatiformans]
CAAAAKQIYCVYEQILGLFTCWCFRGLIFMLVFDYGTMYGILLAFKDYSPRLGVWGSPSGAGLSHFREMMVDPNFIRAFKNTVIINVYNLAFGFTFNVFLALMINEMKIKKVKPVVQTCVLSCRTFCRGSFLPAWCRCSYRHQFPATWAAW